MQNQPQFPPAYIKRTAIFPGFSLTASIWPCCYVTAYLLRHRVYILRNTHKHIEIHTLHLDDVSYLLLFTDLVQAFQFCLFIHMLKFLTNKCMPPMAVRPNGKCEVAQWSRQRATHIAYLTVRPVLVFPILMAFLFRLEKRQHYYNQLLAGLLLGSALVFPRWTRNNMYVLIISNTAYFYTVRRILTLYYRNFCAQQFKIF